jgi:hypothetical protein
MKDSTQTFDQRVDFAIREMITFGYKPQAFMTMRIMDGGTINAVKKLIHSVKISEGFTRLWELGKLDLSLEKIIQEPEWHSLFTDDDRKKAKKRLLDYGFNEK